MILDKVTWIPKRDGERNEHEAVVHNVLITVFSTQDESSWHCYLDGELSQLDATDKLSAMREAVREVRLMKK